jgi:hypothetical protein
MYPANDDCPESCITERQTAFGYWWRYAHNADEPDATYVAATRVAVTVAKDEARRSGKTFLVTHTRGPSSAPNVYVFAHDHPDARRRDLHPLYEAAPNGSCRPGGFP